MIELGTAKVANKLIDKMGQNKNKFAIIGVGGYIAPRHLGAVKNRSEERRVGKECRL